MAGLTPAAVICEIMKDDGTMARMPDLLAFAQTHALKIGAITDLIHYRSRTERIVERIAERPLHTAYGAFRLVVYRDKLTDATHLALVPRVRSHPTSRRWCACTNPLSVMDLLDAESASHSWSIKEALAAIVDAGRGVVVLAAPGRNRRRSLRQRAIADTAPPPSKMDLRKLSASARRYLRDLKSDACGSWPSRARCPSMGGFDLEVTGYEVEPPARKWRLICPSRSVRCFEPHLRVPSFHFVHAHTHTMPIRRIAPSHSGDGLRVGIVLSRFNAAIGEGLLAGALRALREGGVADADITVVSVPGRAGITTGAATAGANG
jgi:hypothetical protein